MHAFVIPIAIGIIIGIVTRLLLVHNSYRQFPSRPHGLIIHVFLGIVASLLGALLIPAILKPDFTAGVFVSIGTAQFHTMRDLERKAWLDVDKGEVIPRGIAYIDGMATAFEARIFMVLAVSALTTLCCHLFHAWIGAAVGVVLALLVRVWKQGKTVADLATVRVAQASVDHEGIMLDGEQILRYPQVLSAASESSNTAVQPVSSDDLLGIVVEPKDFSGILTFAHHGQQQAILHNLSVTVGVQEHPTIQGIARYYPNQQKLLLLILPLLHDAEVATASVLGAPVLEGVFKKQMVKPQVH